MTERLPFSPDPLLLSRAERAEAWLWRRRVLWCLFGWIGLIPHD